MARAADIRTVVRRIDPVVQRRRWALAVVGVLLAVGGGVLVGREWAATTGVALIDPSEALRAQLTRAETRAEVDRATISTLRRDLAEARAELDELQRELVFYREVMAPEEQGAPLVLRTPTLVPGSEPGLWRYQLVVQQGARTDSARRGTLEVTVSGTEPSDGSGDGAAVAAAYPLETLDAARAGDALALNFRYFQRFDGEFRLPAGFRPERLTMIARLDYPETVEIPREFRWSDVVASRSRSRGAAVETTAQPAAAGENHRPNRTGETP